MSEADKLFKELGYKVNNSIVVEELNTTTNTIVDNGYKEIRFYNNKTISIDGYDIVNMQKLKKELKAINLKCKELGWI